MMWPSTIVECDRYVYSGHDVRGSLLQVGTETAAGTAARFGVRQLTWEIVQVLFVRMEEGVLVDAVGQAERVKLPSLGRGVVGRRVDVVCRTERALCVREERVQGHGSVCCCTKASRR